MIDDFEYVGCLSKHKQGEHHTKDNCDLCITECRDCFALVLHSNRYRHEDIHLKERNYDV